MVQVDVRCTDRGGVVHSWSRTHTWRPGADILSSVSILRSDGWGCHGHHGSIAGPYLATVVDINLCRMDKRCNTTVALTFVCGGQAMGTAIFAFWVSNHRQKSC
jgi:hypothetical protein